MGVSLDRGCTKTSVLSILVHPLHNPQLSFALNASAYMRICFTMASRPLLRVGERCSCRPMRGMK